MDLKLSEADPRELSAKLRGDNSANLNRRRGIIALSMAGCASMGLVTLYQIGAIKHLPSGSGHT